MQKQTIVGKSTKKRRRAVELYTNSAFQPRVCPTDKARWYKRRPKHQGRGHGSDTSV